MSLKKKVVFIIFIFFEINAFSQNSIGGFIRNSTTEEQVAYVSIVLQNSKDSLFFGTLSDKNGKFKLENLPKGRYKIEISSLGYKKKIDTIIVEKKYIDLGIIQIELNSITLDDVTVKANSLGTLKTFDKAEYFINKNKYSNFNSVLDILKTFPSVTVDINNLINYKGGQTTILIDNIPAEFVYPDLSQLSVDKILKIELIDASSYSGDIRGGIINIHLKKKSKEKFNGLFTSKINTTNFQDIYKSENFLNLNYNYKKFNFFTNIEANKVNSIDEYLQTGNIENKKMVENITQDKKTFSFLINLGAIYAIDSSSKIVFVLSKRLYNDRTKKSTNYNEANFEYINNNNSEYDDKTLGFLCYYEKLYAKPTQSLNMSLFYSPSNSIYNSEAEINYISNSDKFYQIFDIDNINMNAYLRYNYPLANNTRIRFIWIPHFWIYNTRSNYYENGSLYLPLSLNRSREILNNKFHISFGKTVNLWKFEIALTSKFKHYFTKIETKDFNENYDTTGYFLSFEPQINIVHTINSKNKLTFKYSFSEEFPNEGYFLNYTDKTDPFLWRQGNININSIKYHSAYFGYNFSNKKINFSSDLFYRYTNNQIQSIKSYLYDGIYIEKPENIAKNTEIGLNLSYWYKLNDNLSTNSFIKISYLNLSSNNKQLIAEDIEKTAYSYDVNFSISYNINKNTIFDTQVKFYGKNIYYYGYTSPYLTSSIKFIKNIFNQKIKLTFSALNLTQGILDRTEIRNYQFINTETFINEMDYKRIYELSISYNFRKGAKGTEYIR